MKDGFKFMYLDVLYMTSFLKLFDVQALWACQYTTKPVLSDHIKQDILFAFQTGGCLLLNESSAESSC